MGPGHLGNRPLGNRAPALWARMATRDLARPCGSCMSGMTGNARLHRVALPVAPLPHSFDYLREYRPDRVRSGDHRSGTPSNRRDAPEAGVAGADQATNWRVANEALRPSPFVLEQQERLEVRKPVRAVLSAPRIASLEIVNGPVPRWLAKASSRVSGVSSRPSIRRH